MTLKKKLADVVETEMFVLKNCHKDYINITVQLH